MNSPQSFLSYLRANGCLAACFIILLTPTNAFQQSQRRFDLSVLPRACITSVDMMCTSQRRGETTSQQRWSSSSRLPMFLDDSTTHDKYQTRNFLPVTPTNVWEEMALSLVPVNENGRVKDYVQAITLLRVVVPSFANAAVSKLIYPTLSMTLASVIDDPGVFAVVSMDASQYIQNILTTSGLVFSLLVGQTNYFMYQQQEAIYLALFEEVTMAKSLLEQVALVCRGRNRLYKRILECINRYVTDDLTCFNDKDPAMLIAARPIDDPLEDILYLTSVGEPSIVYQTVRSLRQARASRLGALQLKLPEIQMTLLWALFMGVLFVFPLLGAGSQTIGGPGILTVQSWYFGFMVFGMSLAMRVIYELREPSRLGAYNAQIVLNVMVAGLQEDLEMRLQQRDVPAVEDDEEWLSRDPSIDSDGFLQKR